MKINFLTLEAFHQALGEHRAGVGVGGIGVRRTGQEGQFSWHCIGHRRGAGIEGVGRFADFFIGLDDSSLSFATVHRLLFGASHKI